MAEVEGAMFVYRILGCTVVGVGNGNKTQDNESECKYAHSKEKHLIDVRDGRILGYCTDECTHEHWRNGSHQRVERTADKAELVTFVAAAAEQVQHGVYHGVEHTNRNTCNKSAKKVNKEVARKIENHALG